MSKLYLYAVFHANLNFSYVPKDLYPQVVRNCYWPLLQVVEERQIPLGLEFSANTLELVNSLDPSFVHRLRELWHEGLCEVIGSGYVQSIMPLIPARVNRENLRHGNALYQRLLGARPTMAYVNELVYGSGLPRLYQEAGYESLMVNWESSLASRVDVDLLYRPCEVPTGDGGQMPIIWHSIIAYRAFQKYVQREISLDTYLAGLLAHLQDDTSRAFPLYASDWEAFDFKPWQAEPDGFSQPERGEIDRIAELLALLEQRQDMEFVTPSSLISRFSDRPLVQLESSEHPLPYKKQDLHSVTRWAVGGRDSVRLNTQCHQLYQDLRRVGWHLDSKSAPMDLQQVHDSLWQELCYLWNSDLRTFTTEEKYVDFRNRMGVALDRAKQLIETLNDQSGVSGDLHLTNFSPVPAESEPVSFTVSTNGASPDRRPAYSLKVEGETVACQVIQLVDANKVSLVALPSLAPAQTAKAVIQQITPPRSQVDSAYRVDRVRHIIETDAVRLQLLPGRGGAIESLAFPQISAEPMIRSAPTDSPQAARLVDQGYSGDLVLEDRSGRSVTDHQATELQYPDEEQIHQIFVPIRCSVRTEMGTIWKTYRVYLDQPRVDLTFRFQWRDVVPITFRLGRMIINPGAFDSKTLYCATTNGSEDPERFALQGTYVRHDEAQYGGITARGCFGATEGWVVLGDATKGLGFVTRPALLYSVPLLHYEEMAGKPDNFLLSLVHSLGEWDETSHTLWRGHSDWSLSILGGGADIIARTRSCALLSNGGLAAWSGSNSNVGSPGGRPESP